MTDKKPEESKPRGGGKRKKTKYPNLNKDCNLKVRREYIDTYYVNGIKGEGGEYALRPLNDNEKAWLDKFYGEHVGASFCEKNTLHRTISTEEAQKLRKNTKEKKLEAAKVQKKINQKITKVNQLLIDIKQLKKDKEVADKALSIAEDELSLDQKKQCYDANNARNRCLYNQARKTGKLVKLQPEEYERTFLEQLNEYDLELLVVNDKDLLGE